jgi:hypothetical protein
MKVPRGSSVYLRCVADETPNLTGTAKPGYEEVTVNHA